MTPGERRASAKSAATLEAGFRRRSGGRAPRSAAVPVCRSVGTMQVQTSRPAQRAVRTRGRCDAGHYQVYRDVNVVMDMREGRVAEQQHEQYSQPEHMLVRAAEKRCSAQLLGPADWTAASNLGHIAYGPTSPPSKVKRPSLAGATTSNGWPVAHAMRAAGRPTGYLNTSLELGEGRVTKGFHFDPMITST